MLLNKSLAGFQRRRSYVGLKIFIDEHSIEHVATEVLTAVSIESSIVLVIMACSKFKFNRCFGGPAVGDE